MPIVVPDASGLSPAISTDMPRPVPGSRRVGGDAPDGDVRRRKPGRTTGRADRVGRRQRILTVSSTAPLFSPAYDTQLNRLHAVPGPPAEPSRWAVSPRSTATASMP